MANRPARHDVVPCRCSLCHRRDAVPAVLCLRRARAWPSGRPERTACRCVELPKSPADPPRESRRWGGRQGEQEEQRPRRLLRTAPASATAAGDASSAASGDGVGADRAAAEGEDRRRERKGAAEFGRRRRWKRRKGRTGGGRGRGRPGAVGGLEEAVEAKRGEAKRGGGLGRRGKGRAIGPGRARAGPRA
ncbi:hypothetical protein PVAP13_8NG284004 [Panicum virgatum]|uniref:Uncharacterized protein n=1 Tax=Panicum virgatum TaxID=38727 RepID=A0A8T0PCG9_PANVG|nr:hypothetical protein PVAP13_8NG284004 [Panicum virgatum]